MARTTPGGWLKRLTKLVPPPQAPIDMGSPDKRQAVERSLGLTLPNDLFEFAQAYGSGEFRTDEYSLVLSIHNPFSRQFAARVKRNAKAFRDFWQEYGVYPDTPGLFPIGTGEGPRDVFYYSEGPPSRWPVVTSIPVARLVQMEISLPEFVFRLLDGSLDGQAGEAENPWFRQHRGKFRFQPS
jgi:SMI1 / KNR4 family (SUKH-1)